MRIEPPPSQAEAIGTSPAATAAPSRRSIRRGCAAGPRVAGDAQVADSVKPQIASSGSNVLPTTIAPASRSRRTISQSALAGSGKPSVP